MIRSKVVWSPVETDYLTKHIADPIDQLSIALAKTRSAIDKKARELGLKGKKKVISNQVPMGLQSRVGQRKDLNLFLRSTWEANFLRALKAQKLDYTFIDYEPRTFSFTDHVPPRGMALSYTPDFLVEKNKECYWVEVKGNWLRSQDKTKLKRFKKYYPVDFKNLIAVVSSKNTKTAKFFLEIGVPDNQIIEYNLLKKNHKKSIPNWED
jgi:hypothetical protein